MSRITYELATLTDDCALRRMLRESPMSGAISVSFEREPNYFIGAQVEGPFHQIMIARESSSGEIVGMGSRSIRDVYLNGSPQAVGYLGQLRIKPEYRAWRRALAQGYAFLHHLHEDDRAPFYLTSIIEDNLPARRLLSAGLPGLPPYRAYARLHTLAVYCRRERRQLPMPNGLQLARGNTVHIDEILACLQRNGARYQFAPCWTRDTLFHPDYTPGLAPEDFFLALDGGQVVGCLAAWDQNCFKQTVVRGYSGALGRWRGLVNMGARLAGWPVLPPPGTPLYHCYASHLAVDDDNPQVFVALLRVLYNHLASQGYSYFMIGLSEANPLRPVVTASYQHITYTSQLYLVAWEDSLGAIFPDDRRVPGPEIAVL